MEEYICRDGRMSVNGICAIDQKDGSETYDITKNIIDASKTKNDKILNDIIKDSNTDYFPDLGKEKKKSFSWDMDKPSKVKSFTKTIADGINTYDKYVEDNFGIPKGVQNAARFGVTAYNIAAGKGALAVLGPFALPALIGMGMNKKENERIEKITDQDKQGGNINTVDMMTYDIPTYGNKGFNIHNDDGDKNNNNNSGHNAPGAGKGEGGGYASDYGFI